MSSAPVRLLYKSLLKRAAVFDKFPILKAQFQSPNHNQLYVPFRSFQDEVRQSFRSTKLDTVNLSKGFEIYRIFGSVLSNSTKYVRQASQTIIDHSQIPWFNTYEFDPNEATEEDPLMKNVSVIEPGTILITHPLVPRRSVFLVLKHDDTITSTIRLNLSTGDYLNISGKPGGLKHSFYITDIVNDHGFNLACKDFPSDHYDEDDTTDVSDEEDFTPLMDLYDTDLQQEIGQFSARLEEIRDLNSKPLAPKNTRPIDENTRPTICDGGPHPGWIVLHTKPTPMSHECGAGLRYTIQNRGMRQLLKRQPRDYRVFKGYSCFSTKRLYRYINEGGFMLAKPRIPLAISESTEATETEPEKLQIPDIKSPVFPLLFGPLEKIWAKTMALMGGEFYHFAHFDSAYGEENTENDAKKEITDFSRISN